jgi:DNA-binding MarR family transcriptional regulator
VAAPLEEKDYVALAKCLGVGDPELISKMLMKMMESSEGTVPARDLVEVLGVSYPTVSRIINEMEVLGLVVSEKERGPHRRPGRPRKVVKLNWDAVKEQISECIKSLQKFIEK